jgi:aspartate/methionine/tyrosine aminotransferase
VEFNLADSGVHPVLLGELVAGEDARAALLRVPLHYPPVNGTPRLRERIASLHPGASAGNVLVTVGASEANAVVAAALLSAGDEVVVMEPGYRQVWGLAANLGCDVRSFPLVEDDGWRPDLDALERACTSRTRLIVVTNPNNPAGTILTTGEMDRITELAEASGAWLLADEVYRGTERLTDQETPTFWGRATRAVSVGSLSKAYGLPGLRLGWVVAPEDVIERCWRRHEYATISAPMLSMPLAELALEPPARDRLIGRTRALVREGYGMVDDLVARSGGIFDVVPPEATALAFVRYHLDMPSERVADEIRRRASVLVAAGSHFGCEGHLRITHGLEPAYLAEALRRIEAVVADLASAPSGR